MSACASDPYDVSQCLVDGVGHEQKYMRYSGVMSVQSLSATDVCMPAR